MHLKVSLEVGAVRTVGTGEGLLPRMGPDVPSQVFGPQEPLAAERAEVAGLGGKPRVAAQKTGPNFVIFFDGQRIVFLQAIDRLHRRNNFTLFPATEKCINKDASFSLSVATLIFKQKFLHKDVSFFVCSLFNLQTEIFAYRNVSFFPDCIQYDLYTEYRL